LISFLISELNLNLILFETGLYPTGKEKNVVSHANIDIAVSISFINCFNFCFELEAKIIVELSLSIIVQTKSLNFLDFLSLHPPISIVLNLDAKNASLDSGVVIVKIFFLKTAFDFFHFPESLKTILSSQ